MTTKLVQVLNKNVLKEHLNNSRSVEEIVESLYQKGFELYDNVGHNEYETWEDFKSSHTTGNSELIELEGMSDFNDNDVIILRECPMFGELKKTYVDGKAPEFHCKIVQGYMDQNPGCNSILHPGCIAHQISRQLIVKNLKIKDTEDLNFYQLACRSGATGKVVYDINGLKAVNMSEEDAYKLIDGYGCLYAMVRIPKTVLIDNHSKVNC